jgi:hypothetical protein
LLLGQVWYDVVFGRELHEDSLVAVVFCSLVSIFSPFLARCGLLVPIMQPVRPGLALAVGDEIFGSSKLRQILMEY